MLVGAEGEESPPRAGAGATVSGVFATILPLKTTARRGNVGDPEVPAGVAVPDVVAGPGARLVGRGRPWVDAGQRPSSQAAVIVVKEDGVAAKVAAGTKSAWRPGRDRGRCRQEAPARVFGTWRVPWADSLWGVRLLTSRWA